MAQNINSVTLTGNLTRDPELRHTPGGTAVCSLRVAVNAREKVNGEWTDRGNFFDVIVWGNQGESCVQYLSKGRPIAVQGRLRWREWEMKDGGGKRQTVEIVADRVQFLGSRSDGERSDDQYVPSEQYASGGDDPAATGGGEVEFGFPPDDDIPF